MVRWSWLVFWVLAGTLAGCTSAPLEESPHTDLMLVGLDGKLHGPLELDGDSVHVVIFITHDCPIANSYAPTLKRLMTRYASRPVVFYLVHVDPGLDVTTARKHALDCGYRCPVLLDPEHRVVHALNAGVTPEAMVLSHSGMHYRGRIDDLYVDFGKRRTVPSRHDLRDAIDAVLAGQPVAVHNTRAIGCFIPELP